jgi:hypothetical protein
MHAACLDCNPSLQQPNQSPVNASSQLITTAVGCGSTSELGLRPVTSPWHNSFCTQLMPSRNTRWTLFTRTKYQRRKKRRKPLGINHRSPRNHPFRADLMTPWPGWRTSPLHSLMPAGGRTGRGLYFPLPYRCSRKGIRTSGYDYYNR